MSFAGIYEFKVLHYAEEKNESEWAHGYTTADSYDDVLKKLTRYYGEEAIESIQLAMISDNEFLFFPEEHKEIVNKYNGFL